MRRGSAVAFGALLLTACGQSAAQPPTHAASSARIQASASASPTSQGTCPTASSYGLLIVGGAQQTLELITPGGCIAASAPIAAPSGQVCTSGSDLLPQPVSASRDRVYYRDGDTRIRYITPDGKTGDAATVPGGPSTVSTFSVSPDDRRIAVVTQSRNSSGTISLSLYVEDLGGGHHSVIYTASTPGGKQGTTLWPMGWHGSSLVLAVWQACTFEPVPGPMAWHVSDSATARRTANITNSSCTLSWFPSPAGVGCVGFGASASHATFYDWTGRVTRTVPTTADDYWSGESPNGQTVFFSPGAGIGAPAAAIRIVTASGSSAAAGHNGCLFIDDAHILADDAVISIAPVAVTPLPSQGICAGRFPGGL